MKRNLLTIIILLSQILAFAQFSGGSGTVEDPYHIATAEDLDDTRNYLESSFIQIADIDLGIAPWNEGEGWEPIGDYHWQDPSLPFRGGYDGDGYSITSMYINRPLIGITGLFGSTDGVHLKNINLRNFNITSGRPCGGVVGLSNNGGYISNCIATGTINGSGDMGLLAGIFDGYSIKDCHVAGEIISTNNHVGGLIGEVTIADSILNCTADIKIISQGSAIGGLIGDCSNTLLIRNCYSYSDIYSSTGIATGGFIGGVRVLATTSSLTIENCFSKSIVNSTNDWVGGFIGFSDGFDEYVIINNCFSSTDVIGADYIGGFVGYIIRRTTISNCYSSGNIIADSNSGGFIGRIDSLYTVTVTNSYWDTNTSGLLTTSGDMGEGRSTSEMTDPHAGNTYVDWDFTDVWREDIDDSNNGYPYLGWHNTGIEDSDELLVMSYELKQNYPNPFNNQTTINYTLNELSNISILVYNSNGQVVTELINKKMDKGKYSAVFNADNLNSGVYYYQLKVNGVLRETMKMLYLK